VTCIGDRHSGTAGGVLCSGGKPISVQIRLSHDASHAPVQHTAWMLVNILCRLQGAVSMIQIDCPSGIKALTKLSPLVTDGKELREALVSGAEAIGSPENGFVEVSTSSGCSVDAVISVGFDFCSDASFCAVGNGLCGGIFSRKIAPPARYSALTIGPYVAACLAAGEIFRFVRLNSYVPERQVFLNTQDYTHAADPTWSDMEIVNELDSVLLAGTGAVGTSLLHTLYPLHLRGKMLLADNDEKGVEATNLGRYPLFGWASLGKPKASEAARLLAKATFQMVPYDGGFEHFFVGKERPQIVLSAVDKNSARHALQEQYSPLYLSASTHNLRAEVLRCGPPMVGACLACFNPLETPQRTEDEIRNLLEERPELASDLSKRLHLDANEVVAWIRDRKCSETGDRLVGELRTEDGSAPAFAVGFVSVMSGTLLAAELLKAISRGNGPLEKTRNRVVFQFQNPMATTNTSQFYPRDERCMSCSSDNLGALTWQRRYTRFFETSD
jgi:molybdopterin/thiamine biosynthesis adenylyltransferase